MSGYRTPCHEYITCRFEPGSLGFEIRRVDSASDPVLGNAIISKVVSGGQAEREGVAVFDCVVSVNNEYVAFLTFEAVTEKLRGASRPLFVVLARPWKTAWERIGKGIEGAVKVGIMEKYSQGITTILSRWQPREFTLSRTTLSYSEEGVLKRKIALEEIIQIIPTIQETEFSFVYQGREFRLKCPNSEEKLMWLHAIETTKKGCFDNVDAVLNRMASPATMAASPAVQPQTSQPKKGPPPAPPIAKGPYHLLNKSLVVIQIDVDGADVDASLPPPVVVPKFPSLDLSIERQVLGTS